MRGLVILVIWAIINAYIKDANRKNRQGKPKTISSQQKKKNVFSTFMEEIEKEVQRQKENQRSEEPEQWSKPSHPVRPARPAKPAQPAMVSDLAARPAASMLSDRPVRPKAPPKPVGLEIDVIGGDEEIGGINEAGISIGSNYNKIDLDLKKDILKGIIYSEILAKPKSLRKRSC